MLPDIIRDYVLDYSEKTKLFELQFKGITPYLSKALKMHFQMILGAVVKPHFTYRNEILKMTIRNCPEKVAKQVEELIQVTKNVHNLNNPDNQI